jgi:hypothetical protein
MYGTRLLEIRSVKNRQQLEPDETHEPAASRRVLTGALPRGRRLRRPVAVLVERDGEEAVVTEPEFHMHAAADSESEAIQAFRETLSGYLDLLSEREATLGPHLRNQLEYLRSIIAAE